MRWHGRVVEGLSIGVAENECHILNVRSIHVVDGIATAATDTDDLDDAISFWEVFKIEDLMLVGIYFTWHCWYLFDGMQMGMGYRLLSLSFSSEMIFVQSSCTNL